jgi:ABC-type spermidine/putrescine transport system permease subunit I
LKVLIIVHLVIALIACLVVGGFYLLGKASEDPRCQDYAGLSSPYGCGAWASCGAAAVVVIFCVVVAVMSIVGP